MTWIELTLHTTHEAIDWVRTSLSSTPYSGEIRLTPFAGGEEASSWTYTLQLYLLKTAQAATVLEQIDSHLSSLRRVGLISELQLVIVDQVPPGDRSSNTRVHRIGDRFLILAPDVVFSRTEPNDIPLWLGSSQSFGSGLHPATNLSLRLLERYVQPAMETLDLGSGSGILSVAMAKMGATVLALDNDRTAVTATQDAIYRNHVEAQVTACEGSLGQGSNLGHWMGGNTSGQVETVHPAANFDLIMSNILARINIALAPDFYDALRASQPNGGLLITAGYTTDMEPDLKAALAQAGFQEIDCERQEDWVAHVHRRRSPR